MANLLPPAYRRRMERVQGASLLLATGLVASAVGIVAFLALLPSAFALRYAAPANAAAGGKRDASSTAAVYEAQDLTAILASYAAATSTPSTAIVRALSLRPQGVRIDTIAYVESAAGGSLQLGGSAPSAAIIDAYRSALTGEPLFRQVSVPVGTLAGATNGRFQITITGPF